MDSGVVSQMENAKELHVLAVDDNVVDRKFAEKLLVNSSCKVTTAENGLRALEYLGSEEAPPTDFHGNESSSLKDIPVVIVSSENIPSLINKCLEEGAKMFMVKPLKHSEVKQLTCQLMQSKAKQIFL